MPSDKVYLKLFKVLSEALVHHSEFDLECSNVGKLYEFRIMHKAEQRAVLSFSVSLLKLVALEKDVKFIRRMKTVLDLVLELNK